MNCPTVTPAYGRDYKNKKAAIDDWEIGKDFHLASIAHGDGYTSVRDGWTEVKIRYNKLRNAVIWKKKGE